AGDPAASAAHAEELAAAYLTTCTLTTLLDSLVDADADAASGGHAYLSYYRDEAEAAVRLRALGRSAVAAVAELPGAAHHLMTVGGAVAFYLSAPTAGTPRARRLTAPLVAELRPLLAPALRVFALWRRARGRARGLGRARTECAVTYGGLNGSIVGSMSPCTPPPPPPPATGPARSAHSSSATASSSAPRACAK
ncbi:MAG TPA: DUF2600 family protein, partial [Conexibacter sp.]|nr:DUF2600 family protein [Conexibacter sp.]